MAQPQRVKPVESADPIWARIRSEAEAVVRQEPQLASFIYASLLEHDALTGAVVQRISDRLDHPLMPGTAIRQAFLDALTDSPEIGDAFRADIVATYDRDPATTRFIEPVLYFKGFHAIQTYRLAHWLWGKHRKDFALYLQSRSSAVFQTDIHPAAKIGRGIFLDHATGLVVGETAVIEDDVSLLHDVTLGGTGNENGHCARIAAGSVVIKPVPNNVTVAGVPAKVIGEAGCAEPSRTMDQMLYDVGI